MGQRQVVLADVFVVALDVLAELGTAASEVVGRRAPRRERDVHEVGRASHHAARRARPVEHHLAAPLDVLTGARVDERQPHAVAAGRREVGHLVAKLRVVLHVVERGDGQRAVTQTGVSRRVLHPFASDPDLALLRLQSLEIFAACARWHRSLL